MKKPSDHRIHHDEDGVLKAEGVGHGDEGEGDEVSSGNCQKEVADEHIGHSVLDHVDAYGVCELEARPYGVPRPPDPGIVKGIVSQQIDAEEKKAQVVELRLANKSERPQGRMGHDACAAPAAEKVDGAEDLLHGHGRHHAEHEKDYHAPGDGYGKNQKAQRHG